MIQLLLSIIYVSFISLGLPDAMLGAAWPSMCHEPGRASVPCGRHCHGDFSGHHCVQHPV